MTSDELKTLQVTVSHKGGFSLEGLEAYFLLTGGLKDVMAKETGFTLMMHGMEMSFVIASGTRK
jgi:hypothetical protein